jgi:hypothetical protein
MYTNVWKESIYILKEAQVMKNKLFTMLVVLTILLSVFVGSASAQAYNAHFTTSITYLNVGIAATTTLDLLFYASPTDTAPTSYPLPSLAAGAASSLFVGSLDPSIVPAGFQGDAIMQSDQPMLVTLVQIPQNAGNVKNRALSNGFGSGGPQSLIATVLKNAFGTKQTSIFSIQNADSELNTVEISFYDTSANLVYTMTKDLQAGAPFYVDAGTLTGLPDPFNGSAVVAAHRAGGADGSIVSSVMELDTTDVGLKAFEGVASGASLLYMPSALCNYRNQNTSYAVQNASLTDSTNVTVTFKDLAGTSYPVMKNVGPGAKASFAACEGMPSNSLGSAVVTSDTTAVIAIGKAYGAGLSTAYNGVVGGFEKIALPYVRWADDAHWNAGTHQRTYIAIQNVGADLTQGQTITIEYKDPNGVTVGTDTYTVPAGGLVNGAKFNSDASKAGLLSFGYWNNYTTAGGAAIITGPTGSQLTAIARVTTQTSPGFLTSEDYNSQAVP